MTRKKILWLCSWYPSKKDPFNGDFIQRHAKAASLVHDIHVIHVTNDFQGSLNFSSDQITQEENLTEQVIYFKRQHSLTGKFANHLLWIAAYKKAIRNYIIKNGKPDMVHVHIPMKAGVLGLWVKRIYKIPYVLTEHWGIYNDIIDDGYPSKGYIFKQITKRVFKNASQFISVSNYLAAGVNKLVVEQEHEVISNAVDTDLFFYSEKKPSSFRFIHVSNMVPLKNTEGILRAYKNLLQQNENTELVMIGDTEPGIRDYASGLNLPASNLIFLGEIAYENVAVEMQKADCFILFSDIENSPCVIGEALCCGLPVITTDAGGIPELVDDSNSIMIATKDENALTAAMTKMINSTSLFNQKKIAEVAKGKFSYPVIGEKIGKIYSDVFNSSK